MMNKQKIATLSIATFLAGTGMQYDANAARLEEIIITAQKRSENLQDVPISVSVHTGDMLESLGLNSPDKLVDITPGLELNATAGFANLYIRGIGANTGINGNEATVAAYLDGVYLTDKVGVLAYDFLDVERLEVLKGPQGTLFGRNATGGAISIVTKTPTDIPTGQFDVSYGNYNTVKTRGYLSGPLAEDLYGSISFIYSETDGWLDNVNPNSVLGSDPGEGDATSVRAKLLWNVTEDVSATLSVTYSDMSNPGGIYWQPVSDVLTVSELQGASQAAGTISREPYDFAAGSPPAIDNESLIASLVLEWTTDFADIKSTTAWQDSELFNGLDRDASALPLLSFYDIQNVETFSQEINLASNNEGPFQWTAGVFYFDDDQWVDPLDIIQGVFYPYTPENVGSTGYTRIRSGRTSEVWSVFGEGTYSFTEATRLNIGIRQTEEDVELHDDRGVWRVTANSAGTGFNETLLVTGTPGVSEDYSDTTYSAVLSHDFSEDVMGYASFKQGFKSGVFNITTIGGTGDVPTNPEEVDAWELGLKSTLLDGAMRLNVAAYYYDYTDLQVSITDPNGNGASITENAAEAEIKGLEISTEWLVTDNMELFFGFSYLDAEYSSYPNPTVYPVSPTTGLLTQTPVDDIDGAPLPFASDYTVNIGINYTVPLDQNGNIVLAGNWYHSDGYELFHLEKIEQDSYDRVSMSATWNSASNNVFVKIWGNNLLDEEVLGNVSPNAFGHIGGYQPPRTYGVTAGYKFGD